MSHWAYPPLRQKIPYSRERGTATNLKHTFAALMNNSFTNRDWTEGGTHLSSYQGVSYRSPEVRGGQISEMRDRPSVYSYGKELSQRSIPLGRKTCTALHYLP